MTSEELHKLSGWFRIGFFQCRLRWGWTKRFCEYKNTQDRQSRAKDAGYHKPGNQEINHKHLQKQRQIQTKFAWHKRTRKPKARTIQTETRIINQNTSFMEQRKYMARNDKAFSTFGRLATKSWARRIFRQQWLARRGFLKTISNETRKCTTQMSLDVGTLLFWPKALDFQWLFFKVCLIRP